MTSFPVALEDPSPDESTLAMLAYLLMAFSGFLGPLIIFCVKQRSRFVRFHSLQALIWQAVYFILVSIGTVILFAFLLASLIHNPPPPHSNAPPQAFVYFFPFLWLGAMAGWVLNLILGIVYAIKAKQGTWAAFPIFGKWLLPETLQTPRKNSL